MYSCQSMWSNLVILLIIDKLAVLCYNYITIMINIGGFMIIFEKLNDMRQQYYDKKIKTVMQELINRGIIREFDDEFYSQFDGMLYDVRPVEYYLKNMSMGKCYDASAVLGLAFGKCDDVYICRGNLRNAGYSITGTKEFGHGWVEKDGMVYDTTWQIVTPKQVYYKLFGASVYNRRTTNEFFKDCKHLSDFNIHDKKYYEENFEIFAYPTLIQMLSVAEIMINDKDNEKNRALGVKLKRELPDIDKVYEQYCNGTKMAMKKLSEEVEASE